MKYFRNKLFNVFLLVQVILVGGAILDNEILPATIFWFFGAVVPYYIFIYAPIKK